MAAFWAMDGNDRPARTILLVAAPTLCFLLAAISLAPHVVFMAPIAGAYAAGSCLTVRRLADLLPRIAAGLLLIGVAAALGVLTYFYGIIGYSAFRFFPGEIHHPLVFGQIDAVVHHLLDGVLDLGFRPLRSFRWGSLGRCGPQSSARGGFGPLPSPI